MGVAVKSERAKYVVAAVAVLIFLGQLGQLIAKYQNWEFKNSTEFWASVLMAISQTGITALSGNLFESISGPAPNVE